MTTSTFFSGASWPFSTFFGEISIQIPWLVWKLGLSFKCWVVRVLHVLDVSTIRYMTCKYVLSFCGLSFHFFDGDLWSIKVVPFNKVQRIYFLLLAVLLWSYLRSHCQIQGHGDSQLGFLLRVLQFQLLNVGIWPILSWFFSTVWGRDPSYFFYMWISSCPSAICWKDCSFLH